MNISTTEVVKKTLHYVKKPHDASLSDRVRVKYTKIGIKMERGCRPEGYSYRLDRIIIRLCEKNNSYPSFDAT